MPKKTKGIKGFGSVFKRKDGRYVAQFKVEETGKYKQLYADTEGEAAALLQEAFYQQRQGTLTTGPRQTLKDFLIRWFEDVHKYNIRETTYREHYRILYQVIIPLLGHIQLKKLTSQQVQKVYADKLRAGQKPGSVRNIHKILRNALQYALKNKLVSSNICDTVSLPPIKETEVQTLTIEQAQTLIAVARNHRVGSLIIFALMTGMRHGEICALRWSDIDVETKSLYVCRTVRYGRGFKDMMTGESAIKAGFIEGEPKTAKSKRAIMLPDFVVEILKVHKVRQNEARLKAGPSWHDRDLVFSNVLGGFIYPDWLLKTFRELLSEAGLPTMRFHDLRHTAASLLLLDMKMPNKLVQELLGHSKIDMTWRYTHTDNDMHRKMMDGLDDLFGE